MKHWIQIFSFLLLTACSSNNQDIMIERPKVTDSRGVINDTVGDVPVVIYADSKKKVYAAFRRQTDDSTEILEFKLSKKGFPVVLTDQFGNEYTISGHSTSPNGSKLKSVEQVVGYWFFFPSFYEELSLFNGERIINYNYPTSGIINEDFVFVGSFRDGIPSIDAPEFKNLTGREFIENSFYSRLNNDELVTVVTMEGKNFIYPHRIMEYHEVANSFHNNTSLVLSYCPLTGTSKLWNREIKGKEVEFGVSGLLYNNNLILYDRKSETYWSQILSIAVDGDYKEEKLEDLSIVEMTFQAAQLLGGVSYYLTTDTGFSLDYSISLYDSYKTDSRISFPLLSSDERFHPKERILGLPFENNAKIYRFDDFIAD